MNVSRNNLHESHISEAVDVATVFQTSSTRTKALLRSRSKSKLLHFFLSRIFIDKGFLFWSPHSSLLKHKKVFFELAVGDTVTYTDPKAVYHNFIYNHKTPYDKEAYKQNVAAWATENQVGNVFLLVELTNFLFLQSSLFSSVLFSRKKGFFLGTVLGVDEETGEISVDFGHQGTYMQGVLNCDPKYLSKNITSFYNVQMRTYDGKAFDIEQTKGKVVVCTNIEDTQCVKDLEWRKLAQVYKKFKSRKESDQVIFLLFPNFKFDKPESWVSEKLGLKLGEGFYLMEKNDINGNDTQPAYKFLKALHPGRIDWKQPEIHGETTVWGSTQFIVNRRGLVAQKFGAGTFKRLWLACEGEVAK